jgi:hypothetical protein
VEECELRLNARGRVKGRHAVCEAHSASPAGGTTWGPATARTREGVWRNASPSCSGCGCVMMMPASGARPIDEVRGADADAPARGSVL